MYGVLTRGALRAAAGSLLLAVAPVALAGAQTLPRGLLVAVSELEPGSKPPQTYSRLTALRFEAGAWRTRLLSDPESNVFHKALPLSLPGRVPLVLTLAGMQGAVKAWRPSVDGFALARTLWRPKFGGAIDRVRDGELGDVFGDGEPALVVATHDQGVIAVLRGLGGSVRVDELDRAPDTWVHEVELGDLDGDGVLEVYATPSRPNRRPGGEAVQPGEVVRYVPAKGEGRRVVAALGDRHAKEILVADVDGDGRDELYAAIEPAPGGHLEVRRYDASTPPDAGVLIASLPDAMCRFLTAGDVEGDGRRELVLAANRSGLWLARPGQGAGEPWTLASIDRDSGGFEHAALLADLDGDERDELYAANDRVRELRRYVWQGRSAAAGGDPRAEHAAPAAHLEPGGRADRGAPLSARRIEISGSDPEISILGLALQGERQDLPGPADQVLDAGDAVGRQHGLRGLLVEPQPLRRPIGMGDHDHQLGAAVVAGREQGLGDPSRGRAHARGGSR